MWSWLLQRSEKSPTARFDRRLRLTLEALEDRLAPAVLPPGFIDTVAASGIVNATAMEFAPDGKLFVAEQAGRLQVWHHGTRLQTNFFADAPLVTDATGERGLLGLAFDPAYASNHYVYVYYTTRGGNHHNRVSRFTADATGQRALAGSEAVIWEGDAHSAGNHNGGAIHFGPDGMLYIATGDNANGANAQTLESLHGKLLRIKPDGNIPSDNPFVAQTDGRFEAIWALGLRNPFTFAFEPGTGQLFINDVGQHTWEEINVGVVGANYGWPTAEGRSGSLPTGPGTYHGPLYTYDHQGFAPNGVAITGGAFYHPTQDLFGTAYQGDYFFTDIGGGWIYRLDYDPSTDTFAPTPRLFATGLSAPVDLKTDDAGNLYYLSRGDGRVHMIVPYVALQAEALSLSGFSVGAIPWTSGGKVIGLINAGHVAPSGTATGTFHGLDGYYEVFISYFDENDGAAQLTVSLGGTPIDTWTLNQNRGTAGPLPQARVVRSLGVQALTDGTEVTITGTSDRGEYTRVDYVTFVAVTTPPPAPTTLTAQAGNHQVVLRWPTTPRTNSYNVYRGTSSGSETLLAGDVSTPTFTDTGLNNGVTYYYRVTAVNPLGESDPSKEISATPTALIRAINAGGGRIGAFLADVPFPGRPSGTGFLGGTALHTAATIDTSAAIAAADPAVYQTWRGGTFTYVAGGLTPNTTYQVRLHFAENVVTAAGQRLFDVTINGQPGLSHFDIFAEAGGRFRAITRSVAGTTDGAGRLVLRFVTVVGAAQVNGIEVLTE